MLNCRFRLFVPALLILPLLIMPAAADDVGLHYVSNISGTAYDVVIDGNLAYVAEGEAGLSVIDISSIQNPVRIGSIDTDGFAFAVALMGNLACVADGENGFVAIDVATPSNPVVVGQCDVNSDAEYIDVADGKAYVSGGWYLNVVDLTSPSEPVVTGEYSNVPRVVTNRVAVRGDWIYLNTQGGLSLHRLGATGDPELISSIGTAHGTRGFAFHDDLVYLSGPEGTTVIRHIEPDYFWSTGSFEDLECEDRGVATNGQYLFTGGNKLRVLDVSQPNHPFVAWSLGWSFHFTDLELRDRHLIAADSQNGLTIYELGEDLWDCNRNGQDDRLDVESGISQDSDRNLQPDECQTILYVDDDAPAGGDGLSWSSAFRHLQDALAVAEAGEILFVAGGTYHPDQSEYGHAQPGDREATFSLQSGVTIIGGLAGTEVPAGFDPDNRDFANHASILSGDLLENDQPNFTDYDENSLYVVTCEHGILDGFTVTGAWGRGILCQSGHTTIRHCVIENNNGGVILQEGPGANPSRGNLVLSDSVIRNNHSSYGGGIYTNQSSIFIQRCLFEGNHSSSQGGGIWSYDSKVFIEDTRFQSNIAGDYGGGVYFEKVRYSPPPVIQNCRFYGNRAGTHGEIDGGGGGLCTLDSWPEVINSVFVGNWAYPYGGAVMSTEGTYSEEQVIFRNCTIVGNEAQEGGGIGWTYSWSYYPQFLLENTVLWWNRGGSIPHNNEDIVIPSYSIIQDEYFNGDGLLLDDPRFVHPPSDGYDGWGDDPETPDVDESLNDDFGDLRLLPDSPCIDAGNNLVLNAGDVDDVDSHSRYVDVPFVTDSGVAGGDSRPVVDIGAYEYQNDCNENGIPDNAEIDGCDGNLNCRDCNENHVPDVCEMESGLIIDCNTNGIPDTCDIQDGTLTDSNTNGYPDECETTWHVSADASTGGDGLSWETAFIKIQAALDASRDGDVIVLADGLYTGEGNRDLLYRGKAVTVCSQNGADNCVLDAEGATEEPHRAFVFDAYEGNDSVLKGVTLTGGINREGGSLYCRFSGPTLRDCVFQDNWAILYWDTQYYHGNGGAIQNLYGTLFIDGCSFRNNRSGHDNSLPLHSSNGGAISSRGGRLTLSECSFDYNSVARSGYNCGGAINSVMTQLLISHCRFVSNTCLGSYGGAIYHYGESNESCIRNSTFESNMARENGGGVSFQLYGGQAVLASCEFRNNSSMAGGAVSGYVGYDFIQNITECQIRNCVFSENEADHYGGALYLGVDPLSSGSSSVTNCTFSHNTTYNDNSSVRLGCSPESPIRLLNSIIRGNVGGLYYDEDMIVTYCNIEGGWEGDGNIDVDAGFVSAADGNFRLAPGSACIDAGSNDYGDGSPFDIAGGLRFVDDPDTPDTGAGDAPVIDIGAYEFDPERFFGDFDSDSDVDLGDFAILQACHESEDEDCLALCDGNHDGQVDELDGALFLGWLGGPKTVSEGR